MKVIFLGTPGYVIAPLQFLFDNCHNTGLDLVAIVSQPAKRIGRGKSKKLVDPPVAEFAKSKGIPCLQPEKAGNPDFLIELESLQPDVCVTAAYGQILNARFLEIPRRATINIHPSRLPEYRGPTPVQAALLAGARATAVSILFTVKAVDAGNIILQKDFAIEKDEVASELLMRLFSQSGPMLIEAIELLRSPKFEGQPQNAEAVTWCQKIEKQGGELNLAESAVSNHRKFRAYQPWPGVYTQLGEKQVQFLSMKVAPDDYPGLNDLDDRLTCQYLKLNKELALRSGDGWLLIDKLKPAGSKECSAESYWNGHKKSFQG